MRPLVLALLLVAACSPAASTTSQGGAPTSSAATPTTSSIPGTTQAPSTSVPSSVTELQIVVAGGVVNPPAERVPVPLGNTVRLVITSDVADEIHVHGYDLSTEVAAGGTAEMEFVADVPGIFEVELEDAVIPLVELEVS